MVMMVCYPTLFCSLYVSNPHIYIANLSKGCIDFTMSEHVVLMESGVTSVP